MLRASARRPSLSSRSSEYWRDLCLPLCFEVTCTAVDIQADLIYVAANMILKLKSKGNPDIVARYHGDRGDIRSYTCQGLSLDIDSNQLCCGNTTPKKNRPAPQERLLDVIKSICRFIPSNGFSWVSLDEMTLLNKACKQTGLEDFGCASFHEGLGVLLKSLASDARLNFIGRVCAHSDILRMLCNRLRLREDRRRHPQIADEIVNRPLFITGLPRT